MLNHPFACYRSRYQQTGPWHLRLVAWIIIALALCAGYWFTLPAVVAAMIARQWL